MPKEKSARRQGFRTEVASGLPDRMVLTITESIFARNPRYHEGKTLCLLWTGEVEEVTSGGEEMDYDIEENPVMFPCGEGWDSFDNGITAEHEKNRKVFTDRSAVGLLVDRCVDVHDLEDALADAYASVTGESADEAHVRDARIWVGFKFLLEREEIDYGINKQTNQPMKASRLMPTKVLATPGDTKPKAKAAAKVEAEAEVSGIGLLDSLDAKVLAKLKIAKRKAGDDENAFADAAIEIDEVKEDDALMTAVADGSLFTEL